MRRFSVPLLIAILLLALPAWAAQVGSPAPDFIVHDDQDPRLHTDQKTGARFVEDAARETLAEIRSYFPEN